MVRKKESMIQVQRGCARESMEFAIKQGQYFILIS